jgi:TDG/mug DNA glycosylase family protein
MTEVCSFPPIAAADARVLILGSMPGVASLRAGQYYAHPRNLFWPIVGQLVGAYPALAYRRRIDALKAARIALWDVLASCVRVGSLDADIERASQVPNDFAAFFASHRAITHVFFNGSQAQQSFARLIQARPLGRNLAFQRLPSTSPAHAALTFEQKLAAWRAILIA